MFLDLSVCIRCERILIFFLQEFGTTRELEKDVIRFGGDPRDY